MVKWKPERTNITEIGTKKRNEKKVEVTVSFDEGSVIIGEEI